VSILQTQTTSFKSELYQAIHDLPTDVLKMALYTADADLNEATTAYSSTNEITGTGYAAGGKTLTNVTVSSSGFTAWVSFDTVEWDPAVFTARCALIYNSSKANRSIAVLDFGSDKTTTTKFTVVVPANLATSAIIRSSN
jgi:hypothetical protein